jgi:hypothetical protein
VLALVRAADVHVVGVAENVHDPRGLGHPCP